MAAESKEMHAVDGGHQLPASPMTCQVSTPSSSISSIWRLPRSNVSSPGYSDSKDEEDMDIDPDENSPWTGSALQLASASLYQRSLTLFSVSDLHISEQNNEPAPSSKKAMLLKRAHSTPMPSVEKASRFSVNSAYTTNQSLLALTNESTDYDDHLSDVSHVSLSGITRNELSVLDPLIELNNGSETCGTSRSTCLPPGKQKGLFNMKSVLCSVAFLMIAVAVFTALQQSPSTHCENHVDLESLRHELQHRVHGQHIAVNTVIKMLEEFTNASDKRLLLMSFHGWTGIGKNFVSHIIAEHLPLTNVHKFIVPLHFAHDTNSSALLLSDWVLSNTSFPSCGLHLFIVDEIDKAHDSLVHSLCGSLSELSSRSDASCRAIFLLLTNDGATEINTAVAHALMNGGSREDLQLAELVPRPGSQWYTKLVSAKLIDQAVPFLPLQRQHVAQCIEAELRLRQVPETQQLIDDVLNTLSYFPADNPLFSSSGCRRITHLVDRFS